MTATTRSCSGRLLGLLTLPWVQGPAGTVPFAGEVVEDDLVGHGCGCRCVQGDVGVESCQSISIGGKKWMIGS